MSITTDIGDPDNIHPANKQAVGRRLADIALNKTYGVNVAFEGPVFSSAEIQGDHMIVSFKTSEYSLKSKGAQLKGFEVAGTDHVFHPAEAIIKDGKVIVYSKDVKQPVAIRYAWADNAEQANLYNEAGLPAAPFRSDHWKGVTDDVKYQVGE